MNSFNPISSTDTALSAPRINQLISSPTHSSTLPLVSIIVPVYNSQELLPYCIQSLLLQTYTHLQILLIDDGSTDNSARICDEYAHRDARITVIHQKNSGIAGAQNTGLDNAKGSFIAFCDNDDLVTPWAIEILWKALCHTQTSMSKGRWKTIGSSEVPQTLQNLSSVERAKNPPLTVISQPLKAYQNIFPKSIRILTGKKGEASYFNEANWGRLYRREIWNDIRFVSGKYAQDVRLSGKLFSRIESVVDVDSLVYYWVQHDQSVTHHEKTMKFFHDNFEAGVEGFKNALAHNVTPARSYYAIKGSVLHEPQAMDFHNPQSQKIWKEDQKEMKSLFSRLTPTQQLRCEALTQLRLGENVIYDRSLRARR